MSSIAAGRDAPKNGKWQLCVRDEFCAAHALRHYNGKCENLHGHNFNVDLCVEGTRLAPGTEMLLDFKILKSCLKECLETLDHRLLNEQAPFDKINPSSENIAREIWQQLAEKLALIPEAQTAGLRLVSVTVGEKGSQSATYLELP